MVTWLRQHKETLLQITCGEISDIKMENGTLLATTSDLYTYNRIMQPENLDRIKKALLAQGLTGSFRLTLEKSAEEKISDDLSKLKKFFGLEAEVKNEN